MSTQGWTHYHRWGRCGWGYDLTGFYPYVSLGFLHIAWQAGNAIEENRMLREQNHSFVQQAAGLKRTLADAYEAMRHTPTGGPDGRFEGRKSS